MPRVKRGTRSNKRKKNILQHTKGFRWGRKSKVAQAREALVHAWTYSFRDRKANKRNFRRLWQVRINAATRQEGVSYNQFIHSLKQKNISLDRKVLAELAEKEPQVFKKIVAKTAK